MKHWLSKKSNILFLIILILVAYKQAPVFINNLSKTDEIITTRELRALGPGEEATVLFPPPEARAIAIFWASWCGPCKIEMNRLKKSVESGAIPKASLFAINPFESEQETRKFIHENNYPFTFIETSTIATELQVSVTPTTIFIDKGVIKDMSSGMSLWGIWKAELYL